MVSSLMLVFLPEVAPTLCQTNGSTNMAVPPNCRMLSKSWLRQYGDTAPSVRVEAFAALRFYTAHHAVVPSEQ